MSKEYAGACLCGQCEIKFSGTPKFNIQCYCRDCQRVSGGGNLPQLAVAADRFQSSGPIESHEATSKAGNDLAFFFCGNCGVGLFKKTSMAQDLLFVYAGILDDSTAFIDPMKVYEETRQRWDAS